MSVVGCPTIGPRLVVLVTVAATLLAAWMPLGRTCACGPARGTVRTVVPEPAVACPCCGSRPSDEAPRACCLSHKADNPSEPKGCDCGPLSRPDNPEPTAPPRPADSDDHNVPTSAHVLPASANTVPPAGPSVAEVAVHLADPPPTDLVISLSRFTC